MQLWQDDKERRSAYNLVVQGGLITGLLPLVVGIVAWKLSLGPLIPIFLVIAGAIIAAMPLILSVVMLGSRIAKKRMTGEVGLFLGFLTLGEGVLWLVFLYVFSIAVGVSISLPIISYLS